MLVGTQEQPLPPVALKGDFSKAHLSTLIETFQQEFIQLRTETVRGLDVIASPTYSYGH